MALLDFVIYFYLKNSFAIFTLTAYIYTLAGSCPIVCDRHNISAVRAFYLIFLIIHIHTP